MENKKIGTTLLTGLITGSMLGSGIILLPPIAYEKLGDYAMVSWIIIMVFGGFFAKIFMDLSINFPEAGGVNNAVEKAFGEHFKRLTSYFLILAVFCGPSAVMLTAGEHLSNLYRSNHSNEIYALIMILVCAVILLKNLTSISKITLILSFFIAIILTAGAIGVFINGIKNINIEIYPQAREYGRTILILFWAVVGWEVIGNYSTEVKNPKKTIKRAVIYSFLIVNVVYFLVALSFQLLDVEKYGLNSTNNISIILIPTFGKLAIPLMTSTTVALCISTYILFVGSVARLMGTLGNDGGLPKIFSKVSKNNSPFVAIWFLTIVNSISLILSILGILNIEKIVAYANVFFIMNALFGILASMKLYKTKTNLIMTCTLSIMLVSLLIFSSKIVLLVPFVMILFTYLKKMNYKIKMS
ncbi:MAG: APC family permease [Fusobacteriaceae bacterium]|nr:APC family permease [Fusobacteriaceae bacterium]MBN2838682.1 APC family permease [Fusobacteriaceae bacterium]